MANFAFYLRFAVYFLRLMWYIKINEQKGVYTLKGKVIASASTAILFGGFGYLIMCFLKVPNAFLIAVLGGLIFYVLLFLFMIFYERFMNKRYEKFEKEITSPIFFRANGNFNLGYGKVKNGNIYFCDAGIVCVCLEEKPYTLDEILLQNIEGIQYDNVHFNIFTNDGKAFLITIPNADEVIKILKEKEWIK